MEYSSSKKVFLKTLFFLLFTVSGIYFANAQDSHSVLLEPEFNVILQSEKPWSYSFGIAKRGLIKEVYEEEKISNYRTEHIEINHFTRYSFSSKFNISLGARYRFEEVFDDTGYDELRFIEEVEYEHSNWRFQPEHRFRLEQRIEEILSHRIRYQLGISQPVTKDFAVNLSTEALYTVASNRKPEPEQRFEIGLENTSFEKLELSLGLEYRLDNYIREPQREYFILTGATLNL